MANRQNVVTVESVSPVCLESEPCQHDVHYIDPEGKKQHALFYGPDILRFSKDGRWRNAGAQANHFSTYEAELNARSGH